MLGAPVVTGVERSEVDATGPLGSAGPKPREQAYWSPILRSSLRSLEKLDALRPGA